MNDTPILTDYVHDHIFAEEMGVSVRTLARYRDQGLPFARIGMKVFIHVPGARAWVAEHLTSSTRVLRDGA